MENENLENAEGTENLTDEKPENNKKDNQEKVFKQADLDRIVKERVDREKSAYKTLKDSYDTSVNDYKSQIESYENVIKGFVESAKKDLPENYKSLLEKLPILEQYEFLSKEENQVSKKTIPMTPKGDEGNEKPTKKIGKFI
jgi:hypothetical protein